MEEWGGARVVPPGGRRHASQPLRRYNNRLSGTSVQPCGAALEALRAPASCEALLGSGGTPQR